MAMLEQRALKREIAQTPTEASIASENIRLAAEREFFAARAAELEAHNRLLTDAANDKEQLLQVVEREL
jgi:hypothetical protein